MQTLWLVVLLLMFTLSLISLLLAMLGISILLALPMTTSARYLNKYHAWLWVGAVVLAAIAIGLPH